MSAINNSTQHSQEFQLLQSETSSQEQSDELFVFIQDWEQKQDQDMTIGIVVDEQTFIVLDKKEPVQEFTLTVWQQLVKKYQKDIAQQVGHEHRNIYQPKSRMSQAQKNAIINIPANDTQVRMCLWEIANYNSTIELQFMVKQKEDEQSRQQLLTVLSYQLTQFQMKSLKQNVLKIHKLVKAIGDERESSIDGQRVWRYEKQIMQWIYDSLIRYAIEDEQVKYCKGLQYICLGIVVAYPQFNTYKYSQLLHHFLQVNGFRELYYEGSPRYYKELQRIRQTLREDSPSLFSKVQQSEGEFKKLFVSYFRSCLIYKVTNPEIIRKIFQLLFVQGISAMKSIILRILQINQQQFLSNPRFLQNISTQIINSYFHSNDTSIKDQLLRLFTI